MAKAKPKLKRIDAFDLKPGRKINGKYEILSLLGSGWESEVYKVREIRTGIERAAKFFFPQRNLGHRTSKTYAKKLHKLRQCSILIQYHTEEVFQFRRVPVTVLISEYVDGPLLSRFLEGFPGKRLPPFVALHLLYALTRGIEEIHLLNEYHGDLHTDNVIVNRFGLNFELKLLDLYNWQAPKSESRKDDICSLIQIFYECLGGKRFYARQPAVIKDICKGLKQSLILQKFRTVSQLREHLEMLDWHGVWV